MILFVRNLIVNDIWLKLFSLALATLIWFGVDFSISKEVSPWATLIGRKVDEAVITVPVFAPTGIRNVSVDPDSVQVTLRGDPKLLEALKQRPANVHAQVNLSDVRFAEGLLLPVEVVLPQGVMYTRIDPEKVEVRLSPKTR
jgi:hypothetical protein